MRKFFTLVMMLMALPLAAWSQTTPIYWVQYADTTWFDPAEDVYTISTAEELAGMLHISRKNSTAFDGKTIELGADIVLNDTTGWQNWDTEAPEYAWECMFQWQEFNGTFDGKGHRIIGMYDWVNYGDAGLFDVIGENGIVRNLGLEACWVHDGWGPGGIAAVNRGLIENCYYIGNSSSHGASASPAGIVNGNQGGIVQNCYSDGSIFCFYRIENEWDENRTAPAGVVGYNRVSSDGKVGQVINCYTKAKVHTVEGDIVDAKVVGRLDEDGNIITNCYHLKDTEGIETKAISDTPVEDIAKSAEAFANGEVAWLLQSGEGGDVWGQILTEEGNTYPTLKVFESETLDIYQLTILNQHSVGVDTTYRYVNAGEVELQSVPATDEWQDAEGNVISGSIYVDSDMTITAISEAPVDATGIEDLEGVNIYTQDRNLCIYTPQSQEVTIVSISGAIMARERQEGLQSYSLPKGVYIICIGRQTYKVRN